MSDKLGSAERGYRETDLQVPPLDAAKLAWEKVVDKCNRLSTTNFLWHVLCHTYLGYQLTKQGVQGNLFIVVFSTSIAARLGPLFSSVTQRALLNRSIQHLERAQSVADQTKLAEQIHRSAGRVALVLVVGNFLGHVATLGLLNRTLADATLDNENILYALFADAMALVVMLVTGLAKWIEMKETSRTLVGQILNAGTGIRVCTDADASNLPAAQNDPVDHTVIATDQLANKQK